MDKIKPTYKITDQIEAYINDPATRVYINHNNDTGEWLYSVVVVDSGDLWLDSFTSEEEALSFIREKKLKMA